MLILALSLQTSIVSPPAAKRFSILAPVGKQSCVRKGVDDDVIVCADPLPDQKLPLPDEITSTGAVPINRAMTGLGAMAAEETPCAIKFEGCTTGVNILDGATSVIRAVQKLVAPGSCCEEDREGTDRYLLMRDVANGVGGLFRGKPDTSNRVPIPLDEPSLEGRVRP